jgi:hypothetical protein
MRFIRPLPLFALASLVTLTLPRTAHAVENVPEHEGNGIKGAVGGGLLGAEVVMLVEAALDVKPAWAYIVGGIAGGAAGGVGGYFWESGTNDAKLGMYLLTAGMALAIPTTVAVLSTTAYKPPADYVEDRPPPADEPIAEPAELESQPPPTKVPPPPSQPPGSRAPQRHAPKLALHRTPPLLYPTAPPALVGVSPTALTLSVPAVEFRDLYTHEEQQEFGVEQGTEVRVPVLSFAF